MARLEVPVSAGEPVGKVTILEIESARIADAPRQANVRRELAALTDILAPLLASEPAPTALKPALRAINETLWQIEDDIRDCERGKDFGPRFIALARSIYRTNDRRAALKRDIDVLAGSQIVEEKFSAAYD